jgi:heme/copper-type cytochrome/quinol oxidase subunit 3
MYAATTPVARPVSTAGPSRAGHSMVMGAAIMATAGMMAMIGLGGAYLSLRYGQGSGFAKPATYFNNYAAVIIVFTLGLASLAAWWGVTASRLQNRRWGATGFGLAILFDVAALNLLWLIGYGLKFGVGQGDYQTIVYTLLLAAGIAMVIGIASSSAGLVVALGGHSNASTRYQALAASIGQHFAGLAWLIPFAAIFLKK